MCTAKILITTKWCVLIGKVKDIDVSIGYLNENP